MGMLYSGKVETMMPKLHSQNFEGMELIRPMYLIKESAIYGTENGESTLPTPDEVIKLLGGITDAA